MCTKSYLDIGKFSPEIGSGQTSAGFGGPADHS